MADYTDYSSTSSDTAASDSDASDDTNHQPTGHSSTKHAATANGSSTHSTRKRRASKAQPAATPTRKRRRTATKRAASADKAPRPAGRPPRPPTSRQRKQRGKGVKGAVSNGSRKRPTVRRQYDDDGDEDGDEEEAEDEDDDDERASYHAMADDGMEEDNMTAVERTRESRDDDDEEMMEADSEEGLASLITRSSSLSSPSMLSRARYLAIVVDDLQQLLLPPSSIPSSSTTPSATAASDTSTILSLQRSHTPRQPVSLLSPTASSSVFRTFAFSSTALSTPPESPTVQSVLQHALLNRPFRLHCHCQLFTAAIDGPYLHYDEFADCYRERVASQPQLHDTLPAPLPVDSLTLNFFDSPTPSHLPLSHPVCRALRRSLGRPRRFSRAFIAEERVKLAEYRNYVRVNQRGTQLLHPPHFVPTALQTQRPSGRLVQGQEVVCVHPQTGELHEGVVVGYGQDRADRINNVLFHYYRVMFKQIELGSALVEDVSVMTDPRLPARPVDEDVLPSVDTLVGISTRLFAHFADSSLPSSPLSSPYPSLTLSSSNLPIESHLIASVLKLLDRKSLLIQQLELMNHTYRQLLDVVTAQSTADTPALPSLPFVEGQLSSFVHSYAWVVIQLERTSQSLEGALMHYRLQLTRSSNSRASPLTRRGRAMKREDRSSNMLHPLKSTHLLSASSPLPSAAASASSYSILLSLLTSATSILSSVRASLESEGLLPFGWWQRVRGSGVEEVLLLSVAAVLSLQRGDERAVRAVVELWRRKADKWRASGTAGLPLQVQFEHVLGNLELLLSEGATLAVNSTAVNGTR